MSTTKEQLQKMALEVALRFHLSEMGKNEDADDPTEIYEAIGTDEDIIVWEPFEDWESDSVQDSIWNLASDIERTFAKSLGL